MSGFPLDPEAAKEKFHGHVPAGWQAPENDWIDVTRGVYLGDNPKSLAAVQANPLAHIRSEKAGSHWTTNPDVSRQYASGSDQNWHPGQHGVILHGRVHKSHVIPAGSKELQDAGVWNFADSAEKEVYVRPGHPVNVHAVSAAWRDEQGKTRIRKGTVSIPVTA
jgi:hypothetical protein